MPPFRDAGIVPARCLWRESCLEDPVLTHYKVIINTAQLVTNMTIEVNAAMSRRKSVIYVSCSFMFLVCSIFVHESMGLMMGG